MKYSVVFENVITDISVNPSVRLNQIRFIYSKSGGHVNPKNKVVYPEIRGIEVFCALDKEPETGRKIQEELETALYILEEVLTALVANTQCYCYLAKPISCIYNGNHYILDGSFWHEFTPAENIFRGGERFLEDASFIDEPKNFHPMYHFYRVAKDETNSNDYRALNAWRFLESLHGKQGDLLKKELKSRGLNSTLVDNFYHNIRCAVAHAKKLKTNPLDDTVILPKSYETQFNGDFILHLGSMINYLDKIVKKNSPKVTNIKR